MKSERCYRARSGFTDAVRPSDRSARELLAADPARGVVLVRRGDDGTVTSYQTYDANGFPIKRVDVTGKSHAGIDTPHVQPFTQWVDPETGAIYVNKGEVRPALPEEIP